MLRNVVISRGTLVMAALAAVSFAIPAQARNSTQEFVRKASIANEFEIESSKLALEKSQNKHVKNFAQSMVDDHTKIGENLTTALQSSKSQAQAADKLDDKHQKLFDRLQNASGDDFNRQYIKIQTDAHKEAVKLFSNYSKSGGDPALRQFAADTLPMLKEHLKHVKALKMSR